MTKFQIHNQLKSKEINRKKNQETKTRENKCGKLKIKRENRTESQCA